MSKLGVQISTDHIDSSLMVLCPFVYLMLRHDIPPLTLQPTEVHSAHWVSVRALISPSLSTFEHCDVSERLAHPGHDITRFFLRAVFGQMIFAATQLIPTESLYCSSVSRFLPENDQATSHRIPLFRHLRSLLYDKMASDNKNQRPINLWGLTLGIISDFLGSLPSDGPSKFWAWPTFTPWDLRFVVWVFAYAFRARKLKDLHSNSEKSNLGRSLNTAELRGLDNETFTASGAVLPRKVSPSSAVGTMLDGYFDLLRKAVITTLLLRLGFGTYLIVWLKRKFSGRR